jgi:hypothetical protein
MNSLVETLLASSAVPEEVAARAQHSQKAFRKSAISEALFRK